MSRKIGRNEPCPCGSGKKYKKCCLGRERKAPSRVLTPSRSPMPQSVERGGFRMEPGSYSTDTRRHVPAIANFKRQGEDDWDYHLVLVNPEEVYPNQLHAQLVAARHLKKAWEEKSGGGSDEDVALELSSMGYMSVTGFQIADSEDGEGFALYQTSYDEDLGYNPRAREALFKVVENQLRDGEPAETRQTLERLVREGHSEDEAKELIALVLSIAIFEVIKYEQEFDEEAYVAALRLLPELPEELDDDNGDDPETLS